MRTISTVIIFAVMLTLITLIANFASQRMEEQAIANELTRGAQTMLQIGDAISTIVQGSRSSIEVSFELFEGKVGVVKAGRGFVSLSVGEEQTALIAEPYTFFQYRVSYPNAYPPTRLFDRGARDKAYYNSTEASLIVYHYSTNEETFIATEQRCFLAVAEKAEKLIIHVYMVKLNVEEGSAKSGRLVFTHAGERVAHFVQYLPSNCVVSLYIESGTTSSGESLQLQGKMGQIVEVHAHVVEVMVTWQT